MSTVDILFDIAPEFETSDPTELERIDRFIGYATLELDVTTWDGLWQQGVVLLTAHKLAKRNQSLAGSSASGGPVTSEKVGDWQRSYGSVSSTSMTPGDTNLATTIYGQQFLALREKLVITPILVSGDVPDYEYQQ